MKPYLSCPLCCLALVLTLNASAAPVTGWTIGLNNANMVSLSNETTSSPSLGDNTADDADNTAIYASFPSLTLAVGDKMTLSGSVQISTGLGNLPAAGLANNFRFGIFDVNGSANVSGWLGYYFSAPSLNVNSGVRERTSGAYYSQTGASLVYTVSLADTNFSLVDSTYDFSLSYERTTGGLKLSGTLTNPLGYAVNPWSYEDTSAGTFTFNRVGFLAGDAFNADQFQFSNVDISVTQVPEPAAAGLVILGTLLGCFWRRNRA